MMEYHFMYGKDVVDAFVAWRYGFVRDIEPVNYMYGLVTDRWPETDGTARWVTE